MVKGIDNLEKVNNLTITVFERDENERSVLRKICVFE